MGKEPVEKKELGIPAGDETADTRQIMKLAEGASEGRFSSLVGTRNDKDAFLVFQIELIADDR